MTRKISPYYDDDRNTVFDVIWEYDERGNAIRETFYFDDVEDTVLIDYDDRDLLIRREEYYVKDGERYDKDVKYYSYDEEGNLTKNYLSSSFKRLDEQRIYQYHYSPESCSPRNRLIHFFWRERKKWNDGYRKMSGVGGEKWMRD